MGLDMYLYRNTRVKNYDFEGNPYEVNVTYKDKEIKLDVPTMIEEEVGYWRKANQIHKWFVDNVQGGEDNCEEYDVSRDQLRTLLKLCKQVKQKAILIDGDMVTGMVIENGKVREETRIGKVIQNAEEIAEILPTEGGFFFGSTDYNEFYMEDIDNTIEILDKILRQKPPEGVTQWFKYQSSW
jgi:hypothetical protein